MALVEETLFGTVDKVQTSIERLRAFEPKDRPYWLAFSGGKDSCVILKLAKMAGVKFEAHYSVTSVDPPELVRFIRNEYPEVSFDIPHDKNGNPVSMWTLIAKNTQPPTRVARYCCEKLKESNGQGTVTITGVRWAESHNRKKNQGIVTVFSKNVSDTELQGASYKKTERGGIVMNDDNDEARRAVEVCFRTHKTLVNPIIDWEDDDVWEFINKYKIPYCELYDQGFKRLGCIGCPLGGRKSMEMEFERYPKYKTQYIRTFDRMIENARNKGHIYKKDFKDGSEVFEWWIGCIGKSEEDTNQIGLFDEEDLDYER